jgi:1,4-dihydroxy-2-naphthoate octaprenyltransferase
LGQLIDLDADIKGGKLGVAARLGTAVTKWIYLIVQLILVATVLLLALILVTKGYFLLLAVVPYIVVLPKIWKILRVHHNNPDELKKAAGYNVQLHLLFSTCFLVGWILVNLFN